VDQRGLTRGFDFSFSISPREQQRQESTSKLFKMARRPARCYRYCKNKVCRNLPGREGTLKWSPVVNPLLPLQLLDEYLMKLRSFSSCYILNISNDKNLTCFLYSPTQSPDSTVACLTQRSVSSISAESVRMSMSFLSASTWSPTNTSNWALRHWRLLVFAPTSECTYDDLFGGKCIQSRRDEGASNLIVLQHRISSFTAT